MRLLHCALHLTMLSAVGLLNVASQVHSGDYQSQLQSRLEYERIDISTLGGLNTFAFDIDDKGRVFGVGQKADGGFTYFRWEAGTLEEIEIVPQSSTSPELWDMNRHGQAVGSGRAGTRIFAFLNEGSTTQELGFDAAVAINKRGVVLGYSFHPTLSVQALLWEDGVIRNLTGLGGSFFPRALNDQGDVVGEGSVLSGHGHAVLWRDGAALDLGVLAGCEDSTAGDINNGGQVIGFCQGDSTSRGFVWQDGVMTELGVLGFPFSEAVALNERGQIVGIYSSTTESGGFIWHEGVITDLGPNAHPTAINDRGRIVGLRSGNAFVWEDGVMTDLGPGRAYDINRQGEIVGYSNTPGTGFHPVVGSRCLDPLRGSLLQTTST